MRTSPERHAVFVTLEDGSKYRVSTWMDWPTAIDMWTAMDDQRREALSKKGTLAIEWAFDRFLGIKHYEVRSNKDPKYNRLPERNLAAGFRVLSRTYTTDIAAAKGVLKALGYSGHGGGWVTNPMGAVYEQGWWAAARRSGHKIVRLDGEKGYRAVVTSSLLVGSRVSA